MEGCHINSDESIGPVYPRALQRGCLVERDRRRFHGFDPGNAFGIDASKTKEWFPIRLFAHRFVDRGEKTSKLDQPALKIRLHDHRRTNPVGGLFLDSCARSREDRASHVPPARHQGCRTLDVPEIDSAWPTLIQIGLKLGGVSILTPISDKSLLHTETMGEIHGVGISQVSSDLSRLVDLHVGRQA